MTLKDKLNIKTVTKKTTSKKSSVEDKLHKLIYSAIDRAIKEDKELSKYYNDNLTADTYVQGEDDKGRNEVKLVEVRNAKCITIPIDNVELKQGEEIHTLDKAFKVGEIQVYFKGIKKQVAEFIPTPKNSK